MVSSCLDNVAKYVFTECPNAERFENNREIVADSCEPNLSWLISRERNMNQSTARCGWFQSNLAWKEGQNLKMGMSRNLDRLFDRQNQSKIGFGAKDAKNGQGSRADVEHAQTNDRRQHWFDPQPLHYPSGQIITTSLDVNFVQACFGASSKNKCSFQAPSMHSKEWLQLVGCNSHWFGFMV